MVNHRWQPLPAWLCYITSGLVTLAALAIWGVDRGEFWLVMVVLAGIGVVASVGAGQLEEAIMDTANRFFVSALGNNIVILAPPLRQEVLPRSAALNLAAWLVALADRDGEFKRLLAAVRET